MNEVPSKPGGAEQVDDRRRALIAFLSAGIVPAPANAQLVSALANARRHVAASHSQGRSIGEWLQGEVRIRGIRENAAVLAALETPEMREHVALEFRQQHPDREHVLIQILRYL
jgi:hypothetical protein